MVGLRGGRSVITSGQPASVASILVSSDNSPLNVGKARMVFSM